MTLSTGPSTTRRFSTSVPTSSRPEPTGGEWSGNRFEHYLKGDLKGALDSVATPAQPVPDPRFFAYRAHLLLAVGRTDEAAPDIERALQLAPNDPHALALQTITAVVQGDKGQGPRRRAESRPGRAWLRDRLDRPVLRSAGALDLEGARASVEKAVALDPRSALAWARLAELWASFGELRRASVAAEKAAALEPNLSRTQTVLGYAYLMRVKTRDARAAFEKAIALDPADPLPRLGLGLAKIRDGHLHDGGREVEVAASLDPGDAIVRSYLGKTYYEEKRTGLDKRSTRSPSSWTATTHPPLLRRDREADHEPSGRGPARDATGHRAERQQGRLSFAAPARR